MAIAEFLFLGFLSLTSFAYGANEGWIDAHATFYGGGDASGTMGIVCAHINTHQLINLNTKSCNQLIY